MKHTHDTSPLIFKAPYGVQFHENLGSRWAALLRNGVQIASFNARDWGGDTAAWEAAWNHLYGPSNELIADGIVKGVAELPDRTSPDDQPDMMLVTADELTEIVMAHLGQQ